MLIYLRAGEIIFFLLAMFFLMPVATSEIGDSPYSDRAAIKSLTFFIIANIFNYICDKSILNLIKCFCFVIIFSTFLIFYNYALQHI